MSMNYPDDDMESTAPPADAPRKPQTLGEVVAAYPVGTLVASAAVGVGLMALLSAASHRAAPRPSVAPPVAPRVAAPVSPAPSSSFADLQVQLTQLVRDMAALILSKAEARQAVHDTAQKAGDKAARSWGHLADEAQQVVRGLAPGVQTASQAVREHPVMTAVVVGALGALAASWAMGREAQADAPAAPEAETPPPM